MSIVALKRKSRRFQAPISGQGNKGFSLQGGRRSQGWVGQGVRGRSLTGTPFRGNYARGSGGTQGKYSQVINNRGSCCTNDPDIVKRSTMNTPGYIDSVVTYPTSIFNTSCENGACHQPEWVKDFSELNHSQSSRIDKLTRQAAGTCKCNNNNARDAGHDHCSKDCKSASYHIGGKKYVREMYAKELNYLNVGGEMYQRTGLMRRNKLPTPATMKAWPVALNHNSTCMVNAMTPEQGKKLGLLPDKWMDHRNKQATQDDSNTLLSLSNFPDMLVGSGYGVIPDISNSVIKLTTAEPSGNIFAAISNVSWMLQLDNNHILMNNEQGIDGKSGELYIVNNSGLVKDSFNLMEQGLAGPVYFCEYNKKIYVACYGYWNDANTAGIFVFNQNEQMSNGKAHISPPPSDPSNNSHIHMIDIFKPTDTTVDPFLLAVDLGAKCIYKINPEEDVNFNKKVYDFGELFPRHFVQIPNTNYIALITERGDPKKAKTNNKNQTVVMILQYHRGDDNFKPTQAQIDLGDEFININPPILNGITGAEIKYADSYIYVTVRGYKGPYQDWHTLPANGLFVKLHFNTDTRKLSLKSYINVGQDPRYFTIKGDLAYVANHLGVADTSGNGNITTTGPNVTTISSGDSVAGDISIIKTSNMQLHVLIEPETISPLFILLQ